jgi:ribose 5-phosphate isomerase B
MSDHPTIVSTTPRTVGIAADHGGFALKQQLVIRLREAGHHVVDFGDERLQPDDDYPDFVIPLAREVAGGAMELVQTFLAANFCGEERHRRRLAKVTVLETTPAEAAP